MITFLAKIISMPNCIFQNPFIKGEMEKMGRWRDGEKSIK
jgi:hypothetical protein